MLGLLYVMFLLDVRLNMLEHCALQDRKAGTSTVLLLCGDHGMSDQGSHGGSSSSETAVPLVFISDQYSHGQGK